MNTGHIKTNITAQELIKTYIKINKGTYIKKNYNKDLCAGDFYRGII